MTTLYGISNCDSVKKAQRWLEQQGIDYYFHDFRADGLSQQQLQSWIEQLGLKQLLNKRSTSWKNLADKDKLLLISDNRDNMHAILAVVQCNPTLIKRPLLEQNKCAMAVGFNDKNYRQLFSQQD